MRWGYIYKNQTPPGLHAGDSVPAPTINLINQGTNMPNEHQLGRVFRRRGQAYRIIDREYRETKDGRPYCLVFLRSCCADCGAPFLTAATRKQIHGCFDLNRRCERHARPGVKVKRMHRAARAAAGLEALGR